MKTNKYMSYKKQGKYNNINSQFFNKNINEAKRLYDPEYGDINKPKIPIHKVKKNSFNVASTKNYLQFKQILNNYMNDYEKLRRQNKIPRYPENKYNYQEFEMKKNYVRELFDNFIDLNGKDEFRDTDAIINSLPEDYGDMFLKNDITKKDYAMRYNMITGRKSEEEEEEKKENENAIGNNQYNQENQDNNKLNENCFIENNEEEEEAENENEDNNINDNKNTTDKNNLNNDDNMIEKDDNKKNKIIIQREKEEDNLNEKNEEDNLDKKESLIANNEEENNKINNENNKSNDLDEKNKSDEFNEMNKKLSEDKKDFDIKEDEKDNNISDNKIENLSKNSDNNKNISENKINDNINKEENEILKEEIKPKKFEKLKESENYGVFEEGNISGEKDNEEKYNDFE